MKELGIKDEEKKQYREEYLAQERKHLREQRQKMGLKDFTLVKVIGKGAFGEVRIVRDKHNKKPYAMKTMRKKDMVAKNQVTHVQAERDLMAAADNPWLVKLHYSFQVGFISIIIITIKITIKNTTTTTTNSSSRDLLQRASVRVTTAITKVNMRDVMVYSILCLFFLNVIVCLV